MLNSSTKAVTIRSFYYGEMLTVFFVFSLWKDEK